MIMASKLSMQPMRKDEKIIWWERVGAGSFGEVWRAEWKGTREVGNTRYRECAVKKMDITSPGNFAAVQREITVWQDLDHPKIVTFYEDFQQGRHVCIFIEYLKEGSLYSYMMNKCAHSVDFALVFAFGLDVCSAIKYLHDKDIVHRDIKPANLLLATSEDGTFYLKLCDYGLAREFHKVDLLSAVGTKLYMAPEFLSHKASDVLKERRNRTKGPLSSVVLSKVVDIYSIGVVLNELPTFREPFDDFGKLIKPRVRGQAWKKSDFYLFMSKIAHATAAKPLRPTQAIVINQNTPNEYQQLVEECWADTPEFRPTIDEVIERLLNIKEEYETNDTKPENYGASLRVDDIPLTVPAENDGQMMTGVNANASEIAPQPKGIKEEEYKKKKKSGLAKLCVIQ